MNRHPQSSPGDFYRFGSDRLLLGVAALTYLSYVFEGPLRFALYTLSVESALYLRDVAAVAVVVLAVVSWTLGQRGAAPVVAALAILLGHLAVGIVSLPSWFQALFGLKVFLVFLLGFAVAPLVKRHPDALVRLAAFSFVATAIGIAGNVFVDYPWIGLSYDTAFGTTVASRQWWAMGALRLPGFARASFTAAGIVLVTLVPLLASNVRPWLKTVLIVIAGTTIALTTARGAVTGMTVLLAGHAMAVVFRSRQLPNVFLIGLALMCLSLPLVAVQMGAAHGAVPDWLASFMERVGDMWPRAFALLEDPGQVVWGRGLGGIGVAQEYGELAKANSADNLMIYLLVTFGVLGPIYVAAYLVRLLNFGTGSRAVDPVVAWIWGWTAIWLAYGFTGGMIDLPVMNMAIGLAFGLVFARGRDERSTERTAIGATAC